MSVGINDLVELLRERPGLTCTEIGDLLWGRIKREVAPGIFCTRNCNRQSYALPAGKLVKRAVAQGLVCEKYKPVEYSTARGEPRRYRRREMYLTRAGQAALNNKPTEEE